ISPTPTMYGGMPNGWQICRSLYCICSTNCESAPFIANDVNFMSAPMTETLPAFSPLYAVSQNAFTLSASSFDIPAGALKMPPGCALFAKNVADDLRILRFLSAGQ